MSVTLEVSERRAIVPTVTGAFVASGTSRPRFWRVVPPALALASLVATLTLLSQSHPQAPLRALPPRPEPELLHRLEGGQPRDFFGSWIASGVDLDHDGVADWIAGAPEDDSKGTDRGRAAIYSGATSEVLFEVVGDADDVFLGERVGFAPDVNGDGTPDVLVRARAHGTTGDRVFVVSGVDGARLRVLNAGREGDEFGTWLLALPDLDADGTGEIAVGAPGAWNAAVPGRAYVFSGQTGALLRTFVGADHRFDRFGFSMANVGDEDGDGVVDLAISSLNDDPANPNAGAVRLFSLATGALLGTHRGAAPEDHFGHELSTIPDMNGDGRRELLVGTFRLGQIGYVRAIDPLTGVVRRELRGQVKGDGFGHTVAVIGDVDGDGVADWGVGAPNARHRPSGYENVGRVDVFSGATGARLSSIWGHREGGTFGYAIAPTGDVDGDGHADALVASVVSGGGVGQARVVAPAKAGGGQLAERARGSRALDR